MGDDIQRMKTEDRSYASAVNGQFDLSLRVEARRYN
jgi:hypothetical protein